MTTRTKSRTKAKERARPAEVNASTPQCAYTDCRAALPGAYGTPGVSLSRADNTTLICSRCGQREALEPTLLGSNFRGQA
ncbi:MAG TPA: hypothetical protein VFA39_20055 [Steroidobacteraceae bacterium]|nr:hypothetical protein [Steroidobacteraceae bacterium]